MTELSTYNTNTIIQNSLSSTPPKFYPYTLNDIGAVNPENISCENKAEVCSRLIESAKKHHSFSACANQFGMNLNMFVAGNEDDYVAFFNPIIIEKSTLVVDKEIDMISNPGLILSIKRYKSITLKYTDYEGNEHTQQYDGLTARIIQQCIDILAGKKITDGLSKLKSERAKKALDKKTKQIARYHMAQAKVKK